MSFTFTNYAAIPTKPGPLGDIIGNILSGYTGVTNARYLKPTLEEQLQKAKLYNQYYGPNMESQIGLRGAEAGHLGAMTEGLNISNPFLKKKLEQEQAQREFTTQNPLLGKSGPAGQIATMIYLQQHPELNQILNKNAQNDISGQNNQQVDPQQNPERPQIEPFTGNAPTYSDLMHQSLLANIQKSLNPKGQLTEHQAATERAANFDKAPAATKSLLIAQAAGMGYSPTEAIKAFREEGKGLDDLAKAKGFNPDNLPDPIYPNSTKDISMIKQRKGALKELESIDKDISEWAGDYSAKFFGYSPQQTIDAIKNTNTEKQAQALAARALAPEMSYLRLMVANGKATVHAIKNLEDTSLVRMKIFEPLVKQDVWRKMQGLVHNSLERAMKKSFEAYNVTAKKKYIKNSLNKDNDPLGIR